MRAPPSTSQAGEQAKQVAAERSTSQLEDTMKPRAWLVGFLATFFLATMLLATFNQVVYNKQRANRVARGLCDRRDILEQLLDPAFSADGILVGSSRTRMIGHCTVDGMDFFNLSMFDMRPYEYGPYLEFARKHGRIDRSTTVVVGLDFFASTVHPFPGAVQPVPRDVIREATNPLWQLKNLVSLDTTLSSVEFCLRGADPPSSRSVPAQEWNFSHQEYYVTVYGQYAFDPETAEYLAVIRETVGDARLVVFVSPVSRPLFELLVRTGRISDYRRWITTIVDVFGVVHNFMDINSITSDPTKFKDENHLQQEPARMILARVLQRDAAHSPGDFGVVLTRENVTAYLDELEASLADLDYTELNALLEGD